MCGDNQGCVGRYDTLTNLPARGARPIHWYAGCHEGHVLGRVFEYSGRYYVFPEMLSIPRDADC